MAKWPDPDSEFEPEFEPAFTPKPAFDLDTEADFEPLEIKKPLARGKASDLGDVTSIADALADLGAYDKGRHGNPPRVPETLFRSIEDFQKDQGLDVDGVMLPGGPTLGRINALLPKARPRRVRSDFLQSEPPRSAAPTKASRFQLSFQQEGDGETNGERRREREQGAQQAQLRDLATPGSRRDFGFPQPRSNRPAIGVPPGSLPRIRPGADQEITVAPEDRETLRGDHGATLDPPNSVERLTPDQGREIPGIERFGALSDLVEVVPADGPLAFPPLERRGNPATRAEVARLSDRLHQCLDNHGLRPCRRPRGCRDGDCDYEQRGGTDRNGEEIPERRIPAIDQHGNVVEGTARDSSYADIEITFCRSRRRLLINTYTTERGGLGPDLRETEQAERMIWNTRNGDLLFMIPKAPAGTEWDFDPLCGMLHDSIVELQRPFTGSWSNHPREILERLKQLMFPRR